MKSFIFEKRYFLIFLLCFISFILFIKPTFVGATNFTISSETRVGIQVVTDINDLLRKVKFRVTDEGKKPVQATIYLNGEKIGETDSSGIYESELIFYIGKDYTFTVVADGYTTKEVSVTIEKGEGSQEVTVRLAKETSSSSGSSSGGGSSGSGSVIGGSGGSSSSSGTSNEETNSISSEDTSNSNTSSISSEATSDAVVSNSSSSSNDNNESYSSDSSYGNSSSSSSNGIDTSNGNYTGNSRSNPLYKVEYTSQNNGYSDDSEINDIDALDELSEIDEINELDELSEINELESESVFSNSMTNSIEQEQENSSSVGSSIIYFILLILAIIYLIIKERTLLNILRHLEGR